MLRYKLRTLLIVLALGPPVLAYFGRPLANWFAQRSLVTEVITSYDRRLGHVLTGCEGPYESDLQGPWTSSVD
jgi:hypothetical protein